MNTNRAYQRQLFSMESGEVDKGLAVGLSVCIGFLFAGMIFGSRGGDFLSTPLSLALVLGGTIAAVLIQFPYRDLRGALSSFRSVLYYREFSPRERIQYLIGLARVVRTEGVLFLEQEALRSEDPFLQRYWKKEPGRRLLRRWKTVASCHEQ